jgi:hypothetical protein
VEHPLHAGADAVDGDHLHLIVAQESGDAGVVGALGALVVQRRPRHVELLPVLHLAADDVRDRNAVGASPARVDAPVSGDWHADPHARYLLVAIVSAGAAAERVGTVECGRRRIASTGGRASIAGPSPRTWWMEITASSMLAVSRLFSR